MLQGPPHRSKRSFDGWPLSSPVITHRNQNEFPRDASSLLWVDALCPSPACLVPKSGQNTRFGGVKGEEKRRNGVVRSVKPPCCFLEAYKTSSVTLDGAKFVTLLIPSFPPLNTRWTLRR